ncbi:hypothetical protein ANN_27817 [Periplaneta americana]|uniref:Per a allergen n=1 Tax=Periplaneta americana TaxID=6978 RepID=A0ABQ8RV89_PERAM|nr:hypothetical protein ANN_27817 [Periplaneta americana]
MEELRKLIEDLAKEVKQEYEKSKGAGKVQDFETSMHHVVNRLECLERKVDYLENQSRRNNIVIYGVHEENGKRWEETENLVRRVVAKIGIDLVNSDIERAHRVGRLNGGKRPIVCRPAHFKMKCSILRGSKYLNGTGIVISEDFSEGEGVPIP